MKKTHIGRSILESISDQKWIDFPNIQDICFFRIRRSNIVDLVILVYYHICIGMTMANYSIKNSYQIDLIDEATDYFNVTSDDFL